MPDLLPAVAPSHREGCAWEQGDDCSCGADLLASLRAEDEHSAWTGTNGLFQRAADEIERLRAEIEDLRISVIAFGAPAMVNHAKLHGLPPGHLFPHQYDILARAGAHMASFTRGEQPDGQ